MQAKVRAILERANHPNTPQAEAETALALAFRLMQKYGLDGHSTPSRPAQPHSPIISRTFTITGPYRVRRTNMLWEIEKTISCHSYRDMSETDPNEVVMIAFGTELDLFALDTTYRSAEMLALRLMPAGGRGFKTSWWRGFTEGILEKLVQENRVMVKESHDAGLVLLERSERAYQAMHTFEPNLHRRVSYFNNDENAFSDGQKSGSQFSGGRSALGSKKRRLEKGARNPIIAHKVLNQRRNIFEQTLTNSYRYLPKQITALETFRAPPKSYRIRVPCFLVTSIEYRPLRND